MVVWGTTDLSHTLAFAGLSLCHLGRMEDADATLAGLMSEPVDQFGDLFLEVS